LPLFICPNDDSPMQKVLREGVDLDICPTCKGIWLDRGELDKLLSREREDSETQIQAHQRFQAEVDSFNRNPDQWRNQHPYDQQKQRHRYDGDDDDDHRRGRKRRGGFDLFDIFD
jgi:Zn-finger nucleic acid-binding protein